MADAEYSPVRKNETNRQSFTATRIKAYPPNAKWHIPIDTRSPKNPKLGPIQNEIVSNLQL